MIAWWRNAFGEEEARRIAESISHGHISQGAVTQEFETALARALDVPYVVATTSGSAALLLALMALGIGQDDEVIVPNRAWIAATHAVMMLGAKVVLVDVLADVPVIDVTQVERKISSRTKAIMPVHLCGRAADMSRLAQIAAQHGLLIVEDAAQAIFSRNSAGFLGTQSDAGCFSLSVAKLIATGQGGFVATRNQKTYEELKLIRGHGVKDLTNVTYARLGFNFRFTDIQASIGLVQLSRAAKRIDHARAIYAKYAAALSALRFLTLIPVAVERGEVSLYIEVLCNERDRLIAFLGSRNIQARPFYPGLDSATYLGQSGRFPNSRLFGERGMILPCGPDQSLENVDHVIQALQSYGGTQ